MLMGRQMEKKKFTWVLENFSSLKDEPSYSRPFTISGSDWRLVANPKGVSNISYLSVCLERAPGSYPPGWTKDVNFRLTLVNAMGYSDKILESGECSFSELHTSWGFTVVLPLPRVFTVNNRLTIVAELDIVVPEEPFKKIMSSLLRMQEIQASHASVTNSQLHSSCQVEQKTEIASNQNVDDDDDDDDDASDEGSEDDPTYDPAYDDGSEDDDATSEEGSADDNPSLEDPDDDGASAAGSEDDAASEEGSDDDDDASEEDPDDDGDDASSSVLDEGSSLVSNDTARNESSLDQVKSLEVASQTVENGGRGLNIVESYAATSDNVLKEIRPVKDTMNVNGFEVFSSQVESVRLMFQRHPEIAVEFRAKNQHLRNTCMNFLLSLMETLCQSLEELSNEDLVEADIALTYLKDAGFKVDWLEKKLDQLKENKEKEQSGLARLQEIEENILKLKQQCSELDALAEKEKTELSVTRASLSFDELV